MGLSNLTSLPLPMILLLGLFTYALVTCTLYVLAHRTHMRTRRHDLLVKIKSTRLEYERQLMERQKALMADYDVYDDGPLDVNGVAGQIEPETDAALRKAA
ncbi:MAG: hypothetical protein AAF328_06080 [Planctomycetota bacterium]